MKNKTLLLFFIIFIIILASIIYFALKPAKPKKVIAIVTTLSHPALNMARAGFVDKIKAELSSDYDIKDFNAEGSMQSANLIAKQIAHDPDIIGIFALGSLAAQTLSKAEKTKPIVIAAVSDPKALLPKDAKNICGFSDAIDADYQISTILDLIPDTKNISLLYSPHETNSAVVVDKLEKSLLAHNIKSELVGVYEPQQIPSAALRACEKSKVLLIPLDNQLASSMPAVIKATKNSQCLVILSDKALLNYGAVLAFGVDYQKSGEDAAKLMADIIINKKDPDKIGIINAQDIGVYANKRVIKEKAIMLNPAAKTKIIYEEGN